MAYIKLNMSNAEINQIALKAAQVNKSINTYIISKLNLTSNSNINILTINNILQQVNKLPSGKIFTLPSLFNSNIWATFSNGSKRNCGKAYMKLILQGNGYARFIRKNSANLAFYVKI